MDTAVTTIDMPEMGLPGILQATAAELTELSILADGLGVCPAADMERWQSLDRMSQHLGELAKFLSTLSDSIPDFRPDLADAIAAIRVGGLVSRFTARSMAIDEGDPGDFEMFGV